MNIILMSVYIFDVGQYGLAKLEESMWNCYLCFYIIFMLAE